jgi:hypothetical protein
MPAGIMAIPITMCLYSILVLAIALNLDKLDNNMRPMVLLAVEVLRLLISLGCVAILLFLNPPASKIAFVAYFMGMHILYLIIDIIQLVQVLQPKQTVVMDWSVQNSSVK